MEKTVNAVEEREAKLSQEERCTIAKEMLEKMPQVDPERIGIVIAMLVIIARSRLLSVDKQQRCTEISGIGRPVQELLNLTEGTSFTQDICALAAILEMDYRMVSGEDPFLTDWDILSMYDDTVINHQ